MTDSDIDHIVEKFERVFEISDKKLDELSKQIDSLTTMTTNVNFQLLKLYVDTIPHYNGDPNTLEIFISACEYMFSSYGTTKDQQLLNYLLRVVIGKLTDRAQLLIGTRPEINSWDLIKKSLKTQLWRPKKYRLP